MGYLRQGSCYCMKRLLVGKAFPQFEASLKDEIEKRGVLCLYKVNDTLVKAGEPIKRVFLVLSGCAKTYKQHEQGAEFVINYLLDGDGFGLAVFANRLNNTTVSLVTISAIEPTYVLSLSFTDKDKLAKKFDSFYKYVLELSVRDCKVYDNLIDNIVFHKLDYRISYFLSQLGKATNKSILPINHQQIADSLHASRETVSRLLKKMEGAGKIKLRHNEIEIISL